MLKKLLEVERHNEKYIHEIKILRMSNSKLNDEKRKVDEQLLNSKSYTRKLEGKITTGSRGGVILEVNKQLKQENDHIAALNESLSQKVTSMEDKLSKQSQEIGIFSRALELKVDEFKQASSQMQVDIKASLL